MSNILQPQAPPPPPPNSPPSPAASAATAITTTLEYRQIMQTPPHRRGPLPDHLRDMHIPYQPGINLGADAGAPPQPPPRRLLTPPPVNPPPANFIPLPRPPPWWVYASSRRTGSNIKGTQNPAYHMSNNEMVGTIRFKPDQGWIPVVANLIDICPCFLKHGQDCKARPPIRCNPTPKAHEVCFNPQETVSVWSFLHASIAANCTSVDRDALERSTC